MKVTLNIKDIKPTLPIKFLLIQQSAALFNDRRFAYLLLVKFKMLS